MPVKPAGKKAHSAVVFGTLSTVSGAISAYCWHGMRRYDDNPFLLPFNNIHIPAIFTLALLAALGLSRALGARQSILVFVVIAAGWVIACETAVATSMMIGDSAGIIGFSCLVGSLSGAVGAIVSVAGINLVALTTVPLGVVLIVGALSGMFLAVNWPDGPLVVLTVWQACVGSVVGYFSPQR